MDDSDDLVTDQTNIDACNRQVKKISKSKKKNYKISSAVLNDLSAISEDNDADKLLEENNKLREQNLKLQKILAIAGVKFDADNYASEAQTTSIAQQSSSVTYTPSSTTFVSDIQDVKVSGGSCSFSCNNSRNASNNNSNNDDDYNLSSNNNVECSTDVKNKNSKRRDDDQFAGSSTEVLLCDTSTNVDCPSMPEDQHNNMENDMFSELQVDTTVDLGCKSSSDDLCLTISLPTQSCNSDQKSSNSFNIKTSSNYLNSDSIVDISPPLPSMDQNHFSTSSAFSSNPPTSTLINNNNPMYTLNNSLNNNFGVFGQQPQPNLSSLGGGGQPTMLNLQRFDGTGAPQLNLMNNFNNGIFINQLGQPISFLPPPPQPPSLILNTNTGLLTPQGKILSPANNNLVTPQGNVLLQNCAGLTQPFTPSASSLNYIPQATPLFNGNQMKSTQMPGQMTLNVLPQNSQSRDFLMLPNGKLVPISTQPSVLPATPNTAMQSIITGFSNHVRLQGSQLLGGPNMQRSSQPFGFLPNQFSILGSSINPNDMSRLGNPNQFAINGLPLMAPGQIPPTLQVLNHLPQFSPQTNLSSALNSQPALLQPQNLVMQNNQPCMMAYITPEGTIVLSLQQQGNKKTSDDLQKASQLLSNNLSQEKKTQRRIMPKPPANEGLNLNTIIPKGTAMNCNIIAASTTSSSSSNIANCTADEHEKVSQPYFTSNQLIQNSHDNSKKSSVPTSMEHNTLELMSGHEDFNAKKKTNLKKRDLNNAEKKKRMKTTSKIEPFNNEMIPMNSTSISNSMAQGPEASELQDISCCILNDQIHEQFVQNLNDDDQGDINQFSDLIVMDNEVTSNPTTTSKESNKKSDGLDLKENIPIESSCDSLTSNNHSLLIVSSTTSCHSENVIISSGASSEVVSCINNDNNITISNNTKNCVNTNRDYINCDGGEKKLKKKKKVKHLSQGLLTVEPVISLPSVLCPSLSGRIDGPPNNLYNNNCINSFINDNNTFRNDISNSYSNNNITNHVIHENKISNNNNNNNNNKINNLSSNVLNKKEIGTPVFESDITFQLKDNTSLTEACSTTKHNTSEPSLNENFASNSSISIGLDSKPFDGLMCPDAPGLNPCQPDKVEEGTQTMRHERRKKKKKLKKEKLETNDSNFDDHNLNNIDDNNYNGNNIDDIPPTLTREPSIVDNIPDKFSFSEDQLMDVVEKVENLVAQSVSMSMGASISSSSSYINTSVNDNGSDKRFLNDQIDHLSNKSYFNGIPPKLEPSISASTSRMECQNKRKHQEEDLDVKTNKKLKPQQENNVENHSNKMFSHLGNNEKNKCNLVVESYEGIANEVKAGDLELVSRESTALLTNSMPTCQASVTQRKTLTSNELRNSVLITGQDFNSSKKNINGKESMKVSKYEEVSKSSARHIAIASLARSTNNKVSLLKTTTNKQNAKASDVQVESQPITMQHNANSINQLNHNKQDISSCLDNSKSKKNEDDDGLNSVVIKNEPKSINSNLSGPDSHSVTGSNNDSSENNNNINSNDDENLKNKKDDKSNSTDNLNIQTIASTMTDDIQNVTSDLLNTNSQNKYALESTGEQIIKKKDTNLNQMQNDSSLNIKSKSTCSLNNEINHTSIQSDFNENKHSCNKDSNLSCNSSNSNDKKQNINLTNLKSETNLGDCSLEKKLDSTLPIPNQQTASKENNTTVNNTSNQQKSKTKADAQAPKTKFPQTDNTTILNNNNVTNNNNMNNNNTHFYSMDDSSKKFSYPNIFAPPLFPDPYSSSCAQFSTFPVNGGPTFDTGFMLPPCLPFDSPVVSAGFNYYGGDTSRYSHFGHSSLPSKNPCHNFSSMPSDYPSCSMEPKKVSTNANFINNSNRTNKDDNFKNKIDLFKKDPFMPADFQFDAQFMFPNSDKSNMAYCMDNSNYGLPFNSSTFLNNNINAKGYSNTKLENQVSGKKTFTSPPSSSSSLLAYNRTPSNTLSSPPLHHHPLLFDQKNSSFSTGFDLPFNSSNINSFMENCGIIDQSFMPPINSAFSHNGMKDYNIMKDGLYDDKKAASRSNNTTNKSYNGTVSIAKQTSSVTSSMSNVMVISTATPTNQTKTTTKSSKSSKKATITTQSKTNIDNSSSSSSNNNNNNNNACMFNQPIAPMKTSSNNDMLSSFASNFNNGIFSRTTTAMHTENKYPNQYSSTLVTSTTMNNNNPNLRTCSNIGMDYVSSQILGPSGPHHHPHFGFNHLFPEMDIPNGYLKFGNSNMGDVETMPLHHHHNHKNLHQSPGSNQTMLSDINPFFHPTQYAFDGSSSYFNQSNCSTGPFSMGTFNIRMPRMHHQNNNSF